MKVRRLTPEERQRLQRIVRRGGPGQGGNVVRWRRATMILASAAGNTVRVIARLPAADEETARQVISRFNDIGLDCLDPEWAGGPAGPAAPAATSSLSPRRPLPVPAPWGCSALAPRVGR